MIRRLALALSLLLCAAAPAFGSERPQLLPAPAVDMPAARGLQTAVLAGGCFWGVEGVFEHVRGVRGVRSGYSGGEARTASYERVGTGRTGHAESVEITYDPSVVSYGQLLRVFLSVATDGTQLNRQGPDYGPEYRSVIFFANADQERVARAYVAQLDAARVYGRRIVTEIVALRGFYPAEGYHQDFLALHPTYPYIRQYDMPKLANLQRFFPELYQSARVS